MIFYNPPGGIRPNLQFRCSWWQRWTDYILRSKGRRSRSQRDQMHFSGEGILIDSKIASFLFLFFVIVSWFSARCRRGT